MSSCFQFNSEASGLWGTYEYSASDANTPFLPCLFNLPVDQAVFSAWTQFSFSWPRTARGCQLSALCHQASVPPTAALDGVRSRVTIFQTLKMRESFLAAYLHLRHLGGFHPNIVFFLPQHKSKGLHKIAFFFMVTVSNLLMEHQRTPKNYR